jgi:hypothetical protein
MPPLDGGLSTWQVGTFNMDTVFTGARGAIMVGYVPEPGLVSLLGLGALISIRSKREVNIS